MNETYAYQLIQDITRYEIFIPRQVKKYFLVMSNEYTVEIYTRK